MHRLDLDRSGLHHQVATPGTVRLAYHRHERSGRPRHNGGQNHCRQFGCSHENDPGWRHVPVIAAKLPSWDKKNLPLSSRRPQDIDNGSQSADTGTPCGTVRGTPSFKTVADKCPISHCQPVRCPVPELCPLNRVQAGATVIVRRLTAAPDVNQRLREMGFGEEQRIKVITLQSNLLCQVCNSRLGLSAKLAECILVEPVRALLRGNPLAGSVAA
ncbi:MAG: ferrous iron transport protein A [Pedosphaera sp.]|nr:ferrous iron transport protein A [Pedosphaera sp.]